MSKLHRKKIGIFQVSSRPRFALSAVDAFDPTQLHMYAIAEPFPIPILSYYFPLNRSPVSLSLSLSLLHMPTHNFRQRFISFCTCFSFVFLSHLFLAAYSVACRLQTMLVDIVDRTA